MEEFIIQLFVAKTYLIIESLLYIKKPDVKELLI